MYSAAGSRRADHGATVWLANCGRSALRSSSIATYSLSKVSGPPIFFWVSIESSGPCVVLAQLLIDAVGNRMLHHSVQGLSARLASADGGPRRSADMRVTASMTVRQRRGRVVGRSSERMSITHYRGSGSVCCWSRTRKQAADAPGPPAVLAALGAERWCRTGAGGEVRIIRRGRRDA